MTDELKKEILQLLSESLVIEISKEGDYYGNHSYCVTLYLIDEDGKREYISSSSD